jgi:RimJ/RimL family protein N-acetyltransferase
MGRDVELRTERLLLRSFRVGDVEDALAYRDDPEFARFLPHIPQPFTRRDAEVFVTTNMTEPWETLPTFAVVIDDRVIGTVNFDRSREAQRDRRASPRRGLGLDAGRQRAIAASHREARHGARAHR